MGSERGSGRTQIFVVLVAIALIVGGFGVIQQGSAQSSNDDEAASAASPEAVLPVIPPEVTVGEGDWPVAQGDLAGTRQAINSPINSGNLDQLDVAWTFDLQAAGFFGTVTANPIVVGDTVFIQDMQSNIFAINRWDGSLRWETKFGVGSIGPNGVAVGYGMVYAGLSDTGEVVALNADTGEEIWRQRIGSPPGEGIDMAPSVYNGMVYISTVPGTGVGPTFYQDGDRGVLYVLDAQTGEVAWWFDTTNDGFGVPKLAGGGGLWYPPSFDDEGNIYFGVGNPSPWPMTEACPNGACRPGDNAYTSSMVSLDAYSGAVRWFYQDRPHDLLDLDLQNTPVLISVTIDGADTLVAVGSGKTGNVVAVNADTGDVLWKTPVGKHQNDGLGDLPDDPIEVFPGAYGGVETPIAYANGVLFVTYVDLAQYQGATGPDPDRSANFAEATGGIAAINATDGSILWDVKLPTFVLGGATVANDVVFTAGLDGFVRAFDVKTGTELWSWEADMGINAPLAIADDTIFVAAGFVKMPQVGAATPTAAPEPGTPQLVAIRLGGSEAATPVPAASSPQAEVAATAAPAPETVSSPVASESDAAITMIDIAFDPIELTIPANTDVVVTLTNKGAAIHNFSIDDLGIDSGDVQAGATVTVTINAQPGDYQYYCNIPGHKEAGMVGTLHVK